MFWALLSLTHSLSYPPPPTDLSASREEAAFVQIINGFRSNLRLQKVTTDERLSEAAQSHAEWMSVHHVLTHVGPQSWSKSWTRMYAAGIPYGTLVGENIARGSFSAKNTFIQWFFSREHLEGMMTPEYDFIGVAREGCGLDVGAWGCFWVTDFAQLNKTGISQSESSSFPSRQQIVEAAERVIGPLDPQKKAHFLGTPILINYAMR